MGRKSSLGGVRIKGRGIQFDFRIGGKRYRPTLARIPTEANLRQAREQLEGIKQRIACGVFCLADEFPDYRHLDTAGDTTQLRTCAQVFDQFIAHCEARVARSDFAVNTLTNYRTVLDRVRRPRLGRLLFLNVRYSTLVKVADANKTYNNMTSVLKRAFEFGYRDHPLKFNPASCLKSARMRRTDRPVVDPFRIDDAEMLITAIHCDWGSSGELR